MNGTLTVITGPMFAGKTSKLLKHLREKQALGESIALFKLDIDKRYDPNQVVTHTQDSMPAVVVSHGRQILNHVQDATVVGIDEAQFFDSSLIHAISCLLACGVSVVVSALDKDSNLRPFGLSPQLTALADNVESLAACCGRCLAPAYSTYRFPDAPQETVTVGGASIYEPRCDVCYLAGVAA